MAASWQRSRTVAENPLNDWQPIETMPEGATCLTKIDDNDGVRNVQPLVKKTREPGKTRPMYWSGDMYVYYTPTHWKATA